MAINDPIHYLPATIALLIFASMLVLTHSAPPPPGKACSDEVIAFAPCLPYISNPPNNQTKSPSSQCCDLFASAFDSGTANCLCYLLRDSHLLGFPLNRTRFLSLSSLCVPKDNSGSNGKQTIESLCSGLDLSCLCSSNSRSEFEKIQESGSRNLPPLRGSPRRRHPPPPLPPPPRSKPPAKPGPQKPTISTGNQTMQPKPPMAPTLKSCASKQIISSIQLQPGIMMLIVSLSTKIGIVFRP